MKSHYRNVSLPYPLAERHESHDMVKESETDLEHLRGFVMSIDGYETYCRDHPEDNNALDDMIQEIKRILLGDESKLQLSEVTVTISMQYFMLLAVKT